MHPDGNCNIDGRIDKTTVTLALKLKNSTKDSTKRSLKTSENGLSKKASDLRSTRVMFTPGLLENEWVAVARPAVRAEETNGF